MKKIIWLSVISTIIFTEISCKKNSGSGTPAPPAEEEVLAFPGAEGFGRFTTGGRGGQILYVDKLTDGANDPGTLRYALGRSGRRIIIFKVSGTITLNNPLVITNGNVTIAGQTAPGDGITIRNYPVIVKADNVIIRFMRFRLGDEKGAELGDDADCIEGRDRKNILIDHCSMSWSIDETATFYGNENFTMQWCVIAESLRSSTHPKGNHGYGGMWGGKNASFHHNLLANHDSRNPRFREVAGSAFALTDLVDARNNVIYNWGMNSAYGGEAMNVNIVNCYYKPGPATSRRNRIIAIDKGITSDYPASSPVYNKWGKFYINGNYVDGAPDATANNWDFGVYNQFSSSYGTVPDADKAAMRLTAPHNISNNVTTHTAQVAYQRVLDYAGASLKRDAVDERTIRHVRNGTYEVNGSNGSRNGLIDSQNDVGGWPVLNALPPPTDTDNDGMPDDWEIDKGLNPNSSLDGTAKTLDGKITNVEVYLNSLVQHIITEQLKP
jgi:pectate lyase